MDTNSKSNTKDDDFNSETQKMIDYASVLMKAVDPRFTSIRFIFECGIKLSCEATTIAIAATYFHKFFDHAKEGDYDPCLIGSTCIYLASKVTNDDIKIRDIINVSMNCIHRNSRPLGVDAYFSVREALIQAELLVMRVLGFKLALDLPHKYLLHYLDAIKDWIGDDIFNKMPIARTCWAMLQDSYHGTFVLYRTPQLIAATIIHLTLQIYGIIVPGCDELGNKPWYLILHPSCTFDNVWSLASKLMKLYDHEKFCYHTKNNNSSKYN